MWRRLSWLPSSRGARCRWSSRLVGPLFCVLSSPSLCGRFLFLSVRASDRMRTFNGSCVSLSHFRPAFASRTSVSAKVVVNAGFVEKHTLPTHTHTTAAFALCKPSPRRLREQVLALLLCDRRSYGLSLHSRMPHGELPNIISG